MELKTLTDIGIKRKDNQDNYWSALLDINGEEAGVICLCDGMGGLSRGGFASREVVGTVREFFLNDIDLGSLKAKLYDINLKLYQDSKSKGDSLGTTCTILLCYKGKYNIIHVGDSRCYHYQTSKSVVDKITNDHTVIEKYRKEGKKIPDSIVKKYKNILTRCIGVESSVAFDEYSGFYIEGDMFLVCSDGFWHYLKNSSFSDGSINDLEKLTKEFMNMGESDNITASLLTV